MKIRIEVTVEPDKEQVKALVRYAKSCGHGYDGCTAPGKLIRRLLVSAVEDTVTYIHEKLDKD